MAECVFVFDLTSTLVIDPERAVDWATDITLETMAPKGYGAASFKCRRADVFSTWNIQESFGVKIYDDATQIYEGRIETLPKAYGGTDEFITVTCTGWWVAFEERTLRKRWHDIKGMTFIHWPSPLESWSTQKTWVNNHRPENSMLQIFAGTGDITRDRYEMYRELYELPSGTVRRVTYSYTGRTGEELWLLLFNSSFGQPQIDSSSIVTAAMENIRIIGGAIVRNGSVDQVFTLGATKNFELIWFVAQRDIYDQNDYLHVFDLNVYANYEAGHTAIASPTYSQGQLVQDVILLMNQKGYQISTDFNQLADPGLILNPFTAETPEYGAAVIMRILAYGDSLLRTWLPYVWGSDDTSDGKPRFVLAPRLVDDWEYEAVLNERQLTQLGYEKVSTQLFNSVTVGYTDNKGLEQYFTYKDQASIDAEYERDFYFHIGQGDLQRATYAAHRYIEFHKDRKTQGTIELQDTVKTKGGGLVPVSWVHAGQRIKIINLDEIFFISHTNYTAATRKIQISPDQPQDSLTLLFTQRERGFGALAGSK